MSITNNPAWELGFLAWMPARSAASGAEVKLSPVPASEESRGEPHAPELADRSEQGRDLQHLLSTLQRAHTSSRGAAQRVLRLGSCL